MNSRVLADTFHKRLAAANLIVSELAGLVD
jgi:predicted xylose isomerase-like sugar epimerase